MLSRYFLGLLLVMMSLVCSAQQEEAIRQIMEKYTENADQEFDYQDLQDQLTQLLDSRININKADRTALNKLFFLSPIQVSSILDHIKRFGALLSIYELQVIPFLDDETIRTLLPFIKLGEEKVLPTNFSDLIKKGKHILVTQLETDLPKSQGYLTDATGEKANSNHYEGSPYRWVMRYKYQYKTNLQFGFTSEKDAGEPFLTRFNKKGFDFYSAHAQYKSKGIIKTAIVGDYQLSFGQLLTIGTGLAFGKSAQVLSTKRNFNGIRPYSSVNETSFLRGAAITLGIKNISFTTFYSRVWNDANLLDLDSAGDEQESITSFYLSGYHRTINEFAKKRNTLMQTYGANAQFQKRNLTFGLTYGAIGLGKSLSPDEKIYNQYYERGDRFSKIGLYYDYYVNNINLYGESSFDMNGSKAHLHGMIASLGKLLDLNLFYRKYDAGFTTLQSNGIGESSANRNEDGLYIGSVIKWSKKLSLSSYYDLFRFPWARYLAESPSVGKEYLIELDYKPNKKTLLYVRLRQETKSKNLGGYVTAVQGVFVKRNIRFHADYEAAANIQLKTRVELSKYLGPEKSVQGSVIIQDISLKSILPRTNITARLALFTIDDFDARIYAYENDIPYSYSIPAFLNSGGRAYLMVRYNLKKGLDIWVRAAATYYSNMESFGGGNDLINQPNKTNLSILVKWSF
jgi:hypothetical protein